MPGGFHHLVSSMTCNVMAVPRDDFCLWRQEANRHRSIRRRRTAGGRHLVSLGFVTGSSVGWLWYQHEVERVQGAFGLGAG